MGHGGYQILGEIADAANIDPPYASRVLRLTLQVPAMVETILDGTLGPAVTRYGF